MKILRRSPFFCALALVAALTLTGCPSNTSAPPAPTTPTGGGDPHAGHNHPPHGPHGGHILETSDDHFHAEWTHGDEGLVTIFILDSSAENDHPIEADTVLIETAIDGGDTKEYKLLSVGEGDESAEFSVTSPALMAALKIASEEGATATLKFNAEGKDVTGKIIHSAH